MEGKKQVWYFSNFGGTFFLVFAQPPRIFTLNKGACSCEDSRVGDGDREERRPTEVPEVFGEGGAGANAGL